MIRLLATLGTAAFVVWAAGHPSAPEPVRSPVEQLKQRAADVWSAVAPRERPEPEAVEPQPHALDPQPAGGAAEPPVSPGGGAPDSPRALFARQELTPDTGGDAALAGGTWSGESGAPRAPSPMAGLSRAQADEIRYRLDRVMSLAGGAER